MGLPPRLAAFSLSGDARPGFSETLAQAKELQTGRQPPLDQQLALCRSLVRSLPASLSPDVVAQLMTLGSAWLAAGTDRAGGASSVNGSRSDPAPAAVQLQAEAAHLFLALIGMKRVKLQPASSRQLLQLLCRLCSSPQRQPLSIAATELTCCCMELFAQLPQWYPQILKVDLAAAVAAVAATLELQVLGSGGSKGSLAETPSTTRLLCKLLKALQVLLAEAKKDHGLAAASLAPALQRLFSYGGQQRGAGGGGSGSSTPVRSSSSGSAAVSVAPTASTAAALPGVGSPSKGLLPGGVPASPGKYRPPHARSSIQEELTTSSGSDRAALQSRARSFSDTGAAASGQQPLESSDSESSDVESVGGAGSERHHAGRVRSGALTCLQLLAKADAKSLHGSWTVLLPMSDAVFNRRGGWGATAAGTTSVAHLLLHDTQMRVRHAAAATLTTLLEGPAQRAYLAVAEARDMERQPVRGFITLSSSLGQMLVALHRALLHSAQHEHDPLVLAAALRALGTLLLGAPYHRLPPQLLPLCVAALQGCLARATPPGGVGRMSTEQLPVPSACLACLAAAFSSKAAAVALAQQLLTPSGSPVVPPHASVSGSQQAGNSSEGRHQQLLQLLFAYAACQHPALQLEAVMALRGVAQQHAALLEGCWERLLALGRAGAALPGQGVPQSPRSMQGAADGTLPEKVAQQSVRLPGDYLQAEGERPGQHIDSDAKQSSAENAAPGAAAAAHAGGTTDPAQRAGQWQQLSEEVLAPAWRHSSPLLRAAALAVIAALSPAAYAALPSRLQQQLLGWCCASAAADEASPVRAAALKALGALASAPALCAVPEGPAQALSALSAGCGDSVLAVRIPAAASLATFCHMLSQAAEAAAAEATVVGIGSSSGSSSSGSGLVHFAAMPPALAAGAAVLPACLRLAVATAGDSDKLRPSGLQAIGSLFALQAALAAEQQRAAGEHQRLLAAASAAVQGCLCGGSARVQWAACEAAGQLLACPPPEAQPYWAPLIQQLIALLRGCPNFRSRALAAAALRRLGGCWVVPPGSLVQVMDDVAGVLFDGKEAGFEVAAGPAGSAGAPGQQQAPGQQRGEPVDLGSKAQLEAALVAAVLHLLSLLPMAAAAAAGVVPTGRTNEAAAGGKLPVESSACLAQLQRLVQQAQLELLLPDLSLDPELGASGQDAAGSARGYEANQQFNLSQSSAPLASAAAACLALLQ